MSYAAGAAGRATARPRRSVLFVPGSSARAIDKARGAGADCVVLDLEDMVPPDAKPAARDQVRAAVTAGGFGGSEIVMRVNAPDTPWGSDDVAALAGAGGDALLLPKIDDVDMLAAQIARIDAHGGATRTVWLLAETARGVLDIDRIARASPRLQAIVMGTEDLIKSTGVGRDTARSGLIFALSRCVFAARAADLAVIDGVHVDVKDAAGLAAACAQGRLLGFDGKALIHPAQVAPANAAFG